MKTEHRSPRKDEVPELQDLALRLNAWRQTRPRGQRIPKEIWRAATELARMDGVSPIAAALKLNYGDLQRRVASAQGTTAPRSVPSGFLELSAGPAVGERAERGSVELIKPSGARLTLCLPNPNPQALLPLVQLFLSQRG